MKRLAIFCAVAALFGGGFFDNLSAKAAPQPSYEGGGGFPTCGPAYNEVTLVWVVEGHAGVLVCRYDGLWRWHWVGWL